MPLGIGSVLKGYFVLVLGRLTRYLERRWDFSEIVTTMADRRPRAQIPARRIFLSVFGMFAMRLRSFNALEQNLRVPHRWERWTGGGRLPSADTLGYSLARFDLEPLRQALAQVAHRAKRNKSLHRTRADSQNPYWIGALDGHELGASFKRCCDDCLTRDIEVEGKKQVQYYHRVVVLQLVNRTPALILDVEPVLPKEDEVAAATRIVRRLRQRYPRFLDMLTADALYLRAPFTLAVLEEGLEMVTVLKQENRDLYQDVEGLMKITPASVGACLGKKKVEMWDFEHLTSWPQMGRPVRAVCSREEVTRRVRRARQWKEETIVSDWRWMATVPSTSAPTEWIFEAGHARWDIENRGFNEMGTHWAMDHCFHHDPNAILALLLILGLAFGLTTLFFDRNLKQAFRKGKTRLFLASQLMDDLIRGTPCELWGSSP